MKFLVFSPFQAVERFSFPEAYFAKILKKKGHEIQYCGCGTLLKNFCISHSAYGLTEAASAKLKKDVCSQCIRNRKQMSNHFGDFWLLDDFYDQKNEPVISEFIERINLRTLGDLEFNGFPIGRIASYEFILNHKIPNIELINPQLTNIFKIYVANTLRTYFSFKKILEKYSFDRVLMYNSAYSVNNMVRYMSEKEGIPVAFIHGGMNIRYADDSMYFSWKDIIQHLREMIDYYVENEKRIPLDYSRYSLVLDNFKEKIAATTFNTYSIKRSQNIEKIYSELSLARYEKIVLLSMGSADEPYAVDFAVTNSTYLRNAFRIFGEQLDWIKEIIEFFRVHQKYKLIIRIHPREFPNKRDGVKAPIVQIYEEVFSNLPPNVVCDYPERKYSIYDLFEIIDLHLVAQSTTGLEGATLGIPGLGCVKGLGNYALESVYFVPANKEGYFQKLKSILSGDLSPSIETIRRAFHWSLYLYTNPVINFDTGGFWNKSVNQDLWGRAYRKLRQKMNLPRYSLKSYFRSTKIEEDEKKIFQNLLSGNAELIELREKVSSIANVDEKYFDKYLIGLFSEYYGINLGSFRFFRFSDSLEMDLHKDEVVFYNTSEHYKIITLDKNGGRLIGLPQKLKLAQALAHMIVDRQQMHPSQGI